ncbi:hypothetical protein TNCV_243521 [Trichonephila clavipes]|uniref:Uncharacterized protein n=1 Tax=Trichonephila clavipes TaxID=2585209 RepID=A0A8X7BEV9_TRICX|nr:hypothetical protein TNCV_243521 [Trichonephila clavipes]
MNLRHFGLLIASWNANGVQPRQLELRDFINKHSLYIILILETHLRPGVNFKIPNFTTYKNNRTQPTTQASSVAAILIKPSIMHHYIPTPSLGVVEVTTVVLTPPPDDNPLTIVYLYLTIHQPIHRC